MRQEALKQLESALMERKRNIQSALNSESDVQSQAHYGSGADDYSDEAQVCEQQETSSQIITVATRNLGQVNEALSRMKDGKYGVCDGCGTDIALVRLEALPFALNCLKCQTDLDNDVSLN